MTTPAQQPEHCEHECVCGLVASTNPCSGILYGKHCKHDTRSRQHPPAPEQHCRHLIDPDNGYKCQMGLLTSSDKCMGDFSIRCDQRDIKSPDKPRPPCEECHYQERIDKAASAATLAAYDKALEATGGCYRNLISRRDGVLRWDATVSLKIIDEEFKKLTESLRQQAAATAEAGDEVR